MPVRAEEEIPRVIFENTRDGGAHLYITKSAESTDDRYEIPGAVFTFILSLDGKLAENHVYRVFNEAGQEVFLYWDGESAKDEDGKRSFTTDRYGSFTLKAGQTALFEHIGPGRSYQVTEEPFDGFEQIRPPGGEPAVGTILPDGSAAAFVNQYTPDIPDKDTTNIVINKAIAFPDGYEIPESPEFTFQIKLKGLPYALEDYRINNTSTGLTIGTGTTDGDGRFTLKGGETAIFEGIPADIDYQVIEEETSGWWIVGGPLREGAAQTPATVLNYNNVCASFGVTKAMYDHSAPDVEFTFLLTDNMQNAIPGAAYWLYTTGGTRIDQNDYQTDASGKFTLKPGQAAIFHGLEPGTIYNVSEEATPDYIQKVPEDGAGYTNKGVTNTVELLPFVNEPAPDVTALTVTKVVTGKDGDLPMRDDTFTFRLTRLEGTEYIPIAGAVYRISVGSSTNTYTTDANGKFTLKRNETARFETLKAGEVYRVEELDLPPEYEIDEPVQEAPLDGSVNFIFENMFTHKEIDFYIHKVNSKKEALAGAEFNLYADELLTNKINTNPMISDEYGQIVLTGLKPGVYYLVETKSPSGYQLLTNPIQIQLLRDKDGLYAMIDGKIYRSNDNQEAIYIVEDDAAEDSVHVTVENKRNFTIPDAGGVGIAGFMIAVLGAMIFITKPYLKKRS